MALAYCFVFFTLIPLILRNSYEILFLEKAAFEAAGFMKVCLCLLFDNDHHFCLIKNYSWSDFAHGLMIFAL
jgi:hypothetical protein